MNKILITGGAGFIGSNLSNYLYNLGYGVYVIDDLSTGKKEFLKKGIELQVTDVASREATKFIKKVKPQYIIHLAAQSNVGLSFKNPQKDLEINFFPIVPLVKTALETNVKKFIFSSSAAIFGETHKIPITEDQKKEPTSPYGISKLCTEYYLNFANQKFNLQYVTLRFANVYGENQNSEAEGGVVAIFISDIKKGRKPTIFGNGKQTRDFIYVKDVVDAIFMSLVSGVIGEFNVGTSKETSIADLANLIANISQHKTVFKHEPNRNHGVARNALSHEKISSQLKWEPKTQLDQGLKMTINSNKANF